MKPKACWILLSLVLLLACNRQDPGGADGQSQKDWLAVNDFLYQLQRPNAGRIGETAFDLVVASIAIAGNSPEVIPALKQSPGGDKLVLAYMSIGQAEDYRFYWQPEWVQDPPRLARCRG